MYECITKYIGKLDGGEWVIQNTDGSPTMPWVDYSENVLQLVKEIYDIIPYKGSDYELILEKNGLKNDKSLEAADISCLSGDVVLCMFMAVLRGDRFCEGLMKRYIENGCFERWLLRLKELDDTQKKQKEKIASDNTIDEAKEREVENNETAFETVLEEVRFNQYKKDFTKALELIESLIKKISEKNPVKCDAVSEYFCFDEPMEEILYATYEKPKKELRPAIIPCADIFLQYGSVLIDIKKAEEAKDALTKARIWNPVSTSIAFELAESLKLACSQGNDKLEVYFNLTKSTFNYCFKSEDVARCFRNLGWYFVEKELYEDAACCYVLSLEYEDNYKVQSELYYIQRKTGREIETPTKEDIKKSSQKYDYPIRASENVIAIVNAYGIKAYETKNYEFAKYMFSIAYDLTKLESAKKLLTKIESEMKSLAEDNESKK